MLNNLSFFGAFQKHITKDFIDATLVKTVNISHDTFIQTYALEDKDLPLGTRAGQHVKLFATLPTHGKPHGEEIARSYTPITIHETGTFDLLVKVYRQSTFPDEGIFTKYLEGLKEGQKITFFGPSPSQYYNGQGYFEFEDLAHFKVKQIGLIAGGTGLAVMYPIIKELLRDPTDPTTVNLLFANKTEEDILLKKELDEFAKDPRVKVFYTLDTAPEKWDGFKGYVTKEMIQKTMPPPGLDTFIWASGPKQMDKMVQDYLGQMGYLRERTCIKKKEFRKDLLASTAFSFLKKAEETQKKSE